MQRWPHQTRTTAAVIAVIGRGVRRILVTSPTGGGKTTIAADVTRDFWERDKAVSILTQRKLMVEQLERAFRAHGMTPGIRAAGHPRSFQARVQISSVQTEWSRVFKSGEWPFHPADVAFVDECFVAGTRIETPTGLRLIEAVRPGDKVLCAVGVGTVERTFCSLATDLVRVEFSNGRAFTCTAGHPTFTGQGWRPAGGLDIGEIAFGVEGVRLLWKAVRTAFGQSARQDRRVQRGSMAAAAYLLGILCEEAQEPDVRPGEPGEDVGDAESARPPTKSTWRQWRTATAGTGCPPGRFGKWLARRAPGQDGATTQAWRLADLLQAGHRTPGEDDRDRGGRPLSQYPVTSSPGREEDGLLGIARVDGVARVERAGDVLVYNLQVREHPSYFAEGQLVHNCHLHNNDQGNAFCERVLAGGGAVVGLTATPVGLGGLYDELIVAGTPSELHECGALVKAIHYGPDEPDLRKHKKLQALLARGGKVSDNDAAKVMGKDVPGLFGRVYGWFLRLNPERRPTILFGPDVDGSLWFAEQFYKNGVGAAHIDGSAVWMNGKLLGGRDARDKAFAATRTGEVVVLCNRFVLREGIDLPHLSHGIFATVFGELSTYLQCLDAQTEVLTARGFMGPDDIRNDDKVAAFCCEDGSVHWAPITHRVDRPLAADESMYAVRGPSVDLRVSNLHDIVYKARTTSPDGEPCWPVAWSKKSAERLADYWGFAVPACGVQHAQGVPLSDAQLRFIGWFLTDGTMNRHTRQVVITQAVHQPQIDDLRACLTECGFDFKEYRHVPKNGFANGKDQIRFSVPKGTRTGSLARNGWHGLAPYLDKDFPLALEAITADQLEVLLEAVHLGDGTKKRKADYTPRSHHISTGNRTFAERLQSLCVRRGFRCSLSTERPSGISKKPRLVLNIKKGATLHLAGCDRQNRSTLRPAVFVPGERIWCVSNELGTLIVRRNGKVAVVGNSGGRLLRSAPGKEHATIQDHGGNWHRFGSLNADRHWFLDGTEAMYAGLRADSLRPKLCSGCGHPTAGNGKLCVFCRLPAVDKEPSRCPGCGAIHRQIIPGRKCSLCGFEFTGFRKSRPVFTVEGDLVELAGDLFPPRRVRTQKDTLTKWVQCYFAARNADPPQTFSQADANFARKNYYHPPRDLPLMPREPADWYRRVKDVPDSDLTATYAAVKAMKAPKPEDDDAQRV